MAEKNGENAHRLSRRLDALERRVRDHEEGAARTRVAAGGLGGGAVALFLSLHLPWVRGDGGVVPRFDEEGALHVRSERRAEGTGWELMDAAIADGQWMFGLTVLVMLAVSVLAFVGLAGDRRGVFVAIQIAGWAVPVLLLLFWPGGGEVTDPPETAGGVWVAVFASALVATTAAATFPGPSWMAETRGTL